MFLLFVFYLKRKLVKNITLRVNTRIHLNKFKSLRCQSKYTALCHIQNLLPIFDCTL